MKRRRRNQREPHQVKTLLIAYISADNDLTDYANKIIKRLQAGTKRNANVTTVALVDKLGDENTRLFISNAGKRWTPAMLREAKDFELDMADPNTLGRFLLNVRQRMQAERTILTLIGHGTGPVPQCEWHPNAPAPSLARPLRIGGFPVLPGLPGLPQDHPMTPQDHPMTPQDHPMTPQDHPMTPGDLSSQRTLSTPGLGNALLAATQNGENPFDIIFFDQCFQGNLDVLYEVRKTAKIFVASPNYAWLRAGYVKHLINLEAAESLTDIASRLVVSYQNSLDDRHPNAIFWLESATIEAIATAVSKLGRALTTALKQDEVDTERRVSKAVGMSQFVDTGRYEGRFELGKGDELLGLETFAESLRFVFSADTKTVIYKAATDVLKALIGVHASSRVGSPYVAPDQIWAYTDSLTILAPLDRLATNERAEVWRASLYKPFEKSIATWGPDPKQTVHITQNLAFAREGGWQEFINAWYKHDLVPTVGQPHYVNWRAFVGMDSAETIQLNTSRTATTASLEWQPFAPEQPSFIFKRMVGHPWEQIGVVEASTFVDHYASTPSEYRIVQFGDDDQVIALSIDKIVS